MTGPDFIADAGKPSASPRFHLGVDDVLASLVEVSERGCALFDHAFFATLAALHAQFGISIDLYLFLDASVDGQPRSLRDVSDAVRVDLGRAPWLRLGPHGLDYDHPPYRQTPEQQQATFAEIYREIDRLVGPARRSKLVRLHDFSESYALAEFWQRHGVQALLLTDKPAVAYALPDGLRAELKQRGVAVYQGVTVHRTHARIEAVVGLSDAELASRLDEHIEQHGGLVLCTHEDELLRAEVREACVRCLRHAARRGLLPA